MVAVTGDGGFLFGGAELATAVQHGINLVTVLFNNGAYGNVLRDQRRLFDGRTSGSELQNPDFQTYAKAFGVPKAKLRIRSGATSRLKQVAVDGDPKALGEALRKLTESKQG